MKSDPGAITRFFMAIGWAWMLLVDTKDPKGALGWGVRQLRALHFANHKPRKSLFGEVYREKASKPHPPAESPAESKQSRGEGRVYAEIKTISLM